MPHHPSLSKQPVADCRQRYLVTGAAGFIASKVCELLLAEGHAVVGIDNLNDYYDVRLKDFRIGRLLGGRAAQLGANPKRSVYADNIGPVAAGQFEFRVVDIENLQALEEVFKSHKFDGVFNLAARAGVRFSLENPHIYMSTNALGTLNLLECQRKFAVKKQVLASTSSLYAGCPMPFTEDQPVNTPLSPYAASKKAAELTAYSYHHLYGIDVSVLRYFTVFGPAGRPDMAPFRFIKWIYDGTPITLYGDGSQTRDFTYVDDIARGTILAGFKLGNQSALVDASNSKLEKPEASRPPAGYNIINLGGGNRPVTIKTMIAILEQQIGRKAVIDRRPFNPVDMPDTQADISKAKRLLNWQPNVTPENGFQSAVNWHLDHREWLSDIIL
jgi:UDP-glucuronate 4-epimerase